MRKRIAVAAALLALSGLLIAIEPSGGSPSRRFGAIWPFKDRTEIWCDTLREYDQAIQVSRGAPKADRPTTSIDPSTGRVEDGALREWVTAHDARLERLLYDTQTFAPKSIRKDVDYVMKHGTYNRQGDDQTDRSREKIEQTIFEICGLRMTYITGFARRDR